mmetsp:Transcript_8972/g.40760  ORF Transcript_8972/g.40760 Transcript_8972/m.40760 type:complete len:208 (-) Transcript_8972:1269-1892(-)
MPASRACTPPAPSRRRCSAARTRAPRGRRTMRRLRARAEICRRLSWARRAPRISPPGSPRTSRLSFTRRRRLDTPTAPARTPACRASRRCAGSSVSSRTRRSSSAITRKATPPSSWDSPRSRTSPPRSSCPSSSPTLPPSPCAISSRTGAPRRSDTPPRPRTACAWARCRAAAWWARCPARCRWAPPRRLGSAPSTLATSTGQMSRR